jgi:hypothetical protein
MGAITDFAKAPATAPLKSNSEWESLFFETSGVNFGTISNESVPSITENTCEINCDIVMDEEI